MARGLLRKIGSCSPTLAGLVTGVGSAVGLYALHACIEGQLDTLPHIDALPEVGGCHCWLIGVVGFVAGALCALLIALIRELLEPLVALLCESLLGVRPVTTTCCIVLPRRWRHRSFRRQLLARRLAGRAPPLAL